MSRCSLPLSLSVCLSVCLSLGRVSRKSRTFKLTDERLCRLRIARSCTSFVMLFGWYELFSFMSSSSLVDIREVMCAVIYFGPLLGYYYSVNIIIIIMTITITATIMRRGSSAARLLGLRV